MIRCLGLAKRHMYTLSILVACVCVSATYGQNYSDYGTSQLASAAQTYLMRGSYAEAIPLLKEVLTRISTMTDPQGMKMIQTCRFQLARAYVKTGQGDEASAVFQDYLKYEPRPEERQALRLLAVSHYNQGKWAQVEEVASKLLALNGLSNEDLKIGNLVLGQALYRQEKWDASIRPLEAATRYIDNNDDLQVVQIMIVRALVQIERFSEVFVWVPRLYKTDAKYDITLNLTLMQAGKVRFEQQDFLNALLLYRMVLPREELIAFQQKRIRQINAEIERLEKVGTTPQTIKEMKESVVQIKASMSTLEGLAAYEDEVTFRIGSIYKDVKRYWEGFVLFDDLYQKDATSDIGEAAMLQSVLVLGELDLMARAETRILDYLNTRPDGQYRRTLLAMLMRDRLQKGSSAKVIDLRKYMDETPASTDSDEQTLQAEMHYMLAFAYMREKDTALGGEQFGIIVDNFPNSMFVADATYYRGVTFLLVGDYQSALEYMKLYQNSYKSDESGILGEHYEVSIYREGVCYYGLQRIEEAEQTFTKFIEFAPKHELVSEAYSMRGDIQAAKQATEEDPDPLKRAIEDYRMGFEAASAINQASYAVFQSAKVYKLEFKWQEILDLMGIYLSKYGEEADVSKAVYWKGIALTELGDIEGALAAYIDAVKRFGGEVEQEGVDKIISELVTLSHSLNPEQLGRLKEYLLANLASVGEDGNQVLRLRLMVAQALVDGGAVVDELGDKLLVELEDLSVTTPLTLGLLCDAAARSGDLGKMERVYNDFVMRFDESDFVWKAYQLKAVELSTRGDYAGVLDVVDVAQNFFGTDEYMGWAQITRGDMLLKLGKPDEAFEAYRMVQGVAEWRATVFAEAMYGLGECLKAQFKYDEAHAYFQRTYLLYAGRDGGKWAAKAYLNAAECQNAAGKTAEAIKTLNEMLEDPDLISLPEADTARAMLKKYGGAL